ncbi:MAG TPA: sigma-70 family RNA polymerase sigma factor [Candidatus Acidoferrales bacterium]|nr:sigma-70 family RNA polymerase sigma factor [Candidatus Acidoferrales bacterium]
MTADLEQRLEELRPKLHRYCARMTGSVIDGEDVVQDTLMKAVAAMSTEENDIANLEKWLFRIAHNVAIDFLRRRARAEALSVGADLDFLPETEAPTDDPEIVAASLSTFMQLRAAERGAVILMDVLQYRLTEIVDIMGMSLPAVKSALHRGRVRLRELARDWHDAPPAEIPSDQRALLSKYIDRFNARDFEKIREMLAAEVRLELVNREHRYGKPAVSGYVTNYSRHDDWNLALGLVEGRPAIVVSAPGDETGKIDYFILLQWTGDQVLDIRDFRYARYVMESADVVRS